MTQSLELRELERRSVKYWSEDGLPELVMGALWILWGAAWLFGNALPRGPLWTLYWMVTPAVLALSAGAGVWATRRLKARITFPRTGYVAWKEPTRGQRLFAAVVALSAASAAVVLVQAARATGVERATAPALGVLLSLGFLIASLTQRVPHLLALAGVALVLGLAAGALTLGWSGANWVLMGTGAAAIVVGAVRLRRFLARNPVGAVE
jgi:hypothetical protein